MSDQLANIFDVPSSFAKKDVEITIDESAEFADKNIKEALISGKDALDELLLLCKQTQDHRMYEQYTMLFTSYIEANKKLLDTKHVSVIIRDKESRIGNTSPKTINNNLFVGSTKDLQDLLESKEEDE